MLVRPVIACAGLVAGVLVALSGTTAQAATTRYEAEASPAVCTGTIDSDWTGYSGSGFCNGANSTGGYAQFTVNAATAGTATLNVRFANGAAAARPAALVVNGTTVQTPSFEATGAWSTQASATGSAPMASPSTGPGMTS